MDDKVMTGEESKIGTNESLKDSAGMNNGEANEKAPLVSPINGQELKEGQDGLLQDSLGINYIEVNGKVVPLISPINGGKLEKGPDGLYTCPLDNFKYQLSPDGTIEPIMGPIELSSQMLQNNGAYANLASNNSFMFDGRKPNSASSLTPEDNIMVKEAALGIIEQMKKDGTFDEYAKQMADQMRNQTPTSESLEQKGQNLPNDVDALKQLKEDVYAKMAEQANRQSDGKVNPYDEYKANMARHFEQKSDPSATLHSQYTVQYGETPICYHQLQQINGTEVKVLQQQTFPYDDEFRREMLEPSMVDYASRNPMANQQVVANPDFQGLSSYQTYSTIGNALSISNIDTQYANNIAATLPQIQPQQQVMQPQQVVQKPKSLVLTKPISGFASIALLSAIVGFISGLWLSYLSMLINVK